MKIVAIELGKFNSMACVYDSVDGRQVFRKVASMPSAIHDLLAEMEGERLVIEVGSMAGWVKDLGEAMGMQVEVANVNAEAWSWRKVKRKTDPDDALKLAQMSAWGKLPQVYVPTRGVRQWRALIGYRQDLVVRRTMVKNRIRALLVAEGRCQDSGKKGWSDGSLEELRREAKE